MIEYWNEKYSFAVSTKGYKEDIEEIITNVYPDWSKGLQKRQKQYMRNIVMYVINLLSGSKAVSRQHDWFASKKSPWHKYTFAIKAQDFLVEKKGLAKLDLGYNHKDYDTGISSILHPTNLFYELFSNVKQRPFELDVSNLSLVSINQYDKRKKEGKKGVEEYLRGIREREYRIIRRKCSKVVSRLYALEDNKKFEFRVESLKRIKFINRELFHFVKIGFNDTKIALDNINVSKDVYLTRKYTNFGTGGGRFTQMEIKSYQQVERDIRRKYLTINGELTSEIDYASLHPNLLYCMKGIQNPHDDIYTLIVEELIGKSNKELRDIIKTCMLILINAANYKGFSGAMRKKHKEEIEILKTYGISLKNVKDAVCKVHEPIAEYLHSNLSHQLMLMESDIMESILYEMAERKILGVPLHDSIIVQRGNEEVMKELMLRMYKKHTGFDIGVEVK